MNNCLYCGKLVRNKYCNVTCQNKDQNKLKTIKKYGDYKEFKVYCFECNKPFYVKERNKLFPQKNKYFCSRSCANKRTLTKNQKSKISESLKLYYDKFDNHKIQICEWCGCQFRRKKKQKCCSVECGAKNRNKNNKDFFVECGKKSAQIQANVRRSNNEMYFHELCLKEFSNVLNNKAIFNGWDADVILEDYKVAVLWNGIWHYKKITKKHSIKQVENRDRIKINEIIKTGYEPYIIKDMGKYNKKFVEDEFNKLKDKLRDGVIGNIEGS